MGLFGGKQKLRSGTVMVIKVSPVSYKEGILDRAETMCHLKFRDAPFDKPLELSFEQYDFNGVKAIEIFMNGELLGEVPGYMIDKVLPLLEKQCSVDEALVYGGTDNKRYGCSLTVRFY